MEKFDSAKHIRLVEDMPFSYVSLPAYLDFCAYTLKRNDEQLVVKEDPDSHEFQVIFLPKNDKNWQMTSMSMLMREDVDRIRSRNIDVAIEKATGIEFFYKTNNFINPQGKLKERISQFVKNYSFTIKNKYQKDKIIDFYNLWEGQLDQEEDVFSKESMDFFNFCLANLEKYDIQQVYVEVDGNLVGFAWGVKHPSGNWAGLHLKVDYKYKGLSRFINHERAKLFPDLDLFTLGTGCNDPGLTQFKKELGPVKEQEYFYVLTRGQK